MGWLEGGVYHEYVDYGRCWWVKLQIYHPGDQSSSIGYITQFQDGWREVPLHGPGFDTNNRAVWHEIQNYCIGTTTYDWIREFEWEKYGTAAWLVLLQQYEGTESENKCIVLANQDISLHPQQGIFYKI